MSGDELRERLQRGLARAPRQRMRIEGFRRAAVLVPLFATPSGVEVLLTVRAATLPHHAGQIAFPGGGLEAGEGVVEAALREAFEEIGLEVPPGAVLGCLDDLPSPARYVATPVVALLDGERPLRPNPAEVDEVFAVPLADLLTLVPSSEERQLLDIRRRIYSYRWRERTIWGFTGNVVRDLLGRLD